MSLFLLSLFCIAFAAAVTFYLLYDRAGRQVLAERALAETAAENARQTIEQRTAELMAEGERVRQHYEAESRRIIEQIYGDLAQARQDLERFQGCESMFQAEEEARTALAAALGEGGTLRAQAVALVEAAKKVADEEGKEGHRRAQAIYHQAEALLAQSTRDAARILVEAERRATELAGDAYIALRDKQTLDQAIVAVRNVIDGYGDRYIIPTHSLLDDLAADLGHTAAGEGLRVAREQSRVLVLDGLAANCDYVEKNRRDTAVRFVIDAFNGRVDAILSRSRHDNFGTLSQEIQDAFSLVNLNGEAFRGARVSPAYRDARLNELRWAAAVHALKLKEREEQRRIQEQIRQEEKERRERERAVEEAAKEQEIIRKALAKAREEVEHANAQDRVKLEAQLGELRQQLADAEAKSQRAISMAQQTRSGHVYIISNVGSFGEDVIKIGMTRRRNPDERISELGDASVPFSFDVHAMIHTQDAPALERELHTRFEQARVNKVNYRKEFFRIPIHELREFVAERGLEATFTLTAEAREFRESQAYEKMAPEDRIKYQVKETPVEELFED